MFRYELRCEFTIGETIVHRECNARNMAGANCETFAAYITRLVR